VLEVITDSQTRREKLARIKGRSVAADSELASAVAEIIGEVRRRGDAALLDYTARFDGVRLRASDLRVGEDALRESAARAGVRVLEALRASIRNVRAFHERERAESWEFETGRGVRLGQRVSPVEAAGLYVPGGTASYPSSVVMNVVPAQVAGGKRIAVVTPPRTLSQTPAVAAALVELGVNEIYQVGGAQAVAALAYGTETIPRVDVITGPGNRYVAAAKRLVFGAVGIDSVAGPSEVVVLADDGARADFIAADLLAQAEHGEDASAVLVTTDYALAARVADEVARQAETLPRRRIVERSLADHGKTRFVPDFALDREAFGADRSRLLRALQQRLPQAARAQPNGFVLGRDGRGARQIGPLVARDEETAMELLRSALAAVPAPLYVDVVDHAPKLQQWLQTHGFAFQRPFTRMVHGGERAPGNEKLVYLVAGPELG